MKERQEYLVPGLSPPLSHYTDAVRYGDLLFVSGITPLDEEFRVVGGDDVVRQAEQLFANMQKVLEQAGATFADVLKVTVYLTDVEDRAKINPVRARFFGDARPASTLIGVSGLAVSGMKVEVDAIVAMRDNA